MTLEQLCGCFFSVVGLVVAILVSALFGLGVWGILGCAALGWFVGWFCGVGIAAILFEIDCRRARTKENKSEEAERRHR